MSITMDEFVENVEEAIATSMKYRKLEESYKKVTNKSLVEVLKIIKQYGLPTESVEIIEHNQKPIVPVKFDEWYKKISISGYNASKKEIAIYLISRAGWGYCLSLDTRGNEHYDIELSEWVDGNKELAVKAVLFGYEVEEEPRFITILVTNASHKWLLARTEAGNIVLEKVSLTMFKEKYSTERYILNKDEIMSVDQGDKLFKNFAIEVEKGVHGWKIKSR